MGELNGSTMDYQKAFEKFNSEFPVSVDATRRLRQASAEIFAKQGLPSRKIEDWKYTGLKGLTENQFSLRKPLATLSDDVRRMIANERHNDFYDIIFLNGEYRPELNSSSIVGFTLQSRPATSEFHQTENWGGDSYLHSLNGMFSQEEIEIYIQKNAVLSKPLRLLFLNHLNEGPSLMSFPRISIYAGSSSKATVIESHRGLEASRYFVNSMTRVHLEEKAVLEFIFHQNQSETAISASQSLFHLSQNSRLQLMSFQSGASLSRHNVDVNLLGSNAEVELLGLSVLALNQHCDNKTLVRHHVGHCTSRQLYKSILAGEARYIFSGKIKIDLNAQKASSEQLNKNLLMSSKAEVDSEPQLEVEADDVKATHGSTVGQLSAEELFYFKSRGISEKKALDLLSFGFAADVMDHVENDVLKSFLKTDLQKSFEKLSLGLGKQAVNLGAL